MPAQRAPSEVPPAPAPPRLRGGALTRRARWEQLALERFEVHVPPPRTKWTRRVPHPVLIGHAASLSQTLRAHNIIPIGIHRDRAARQGASAVQAAPPPGSGGGAFRERLPLPLGAMGNIPLTPLSDDGVTDDAVTFVFQNEYKRYFGLVK